MGIFAAKKLTEGFLWNWIKEFIFIDEKKHEHIVKKVASGKYGAKSWGLNREIFSGDRRSGDRGYF